LHTDVLFLGLRPAHRRIGFVLIAGKRKTGGKLRLDATRFVNAARSGRVGEN
jgi:hypothetical protein